MSGILYLICLAATACIAVMLLLKQEKEPRLEKAARLYLTAYSLLLVPALIITAFAAGEESGYFLVTSMLLVVSGVTTVIAWFDHKLARR